MPTFPYPTSPGFTGLLAIGFDRLKDARTYAWFFGATVGINVVSVLAPNTRVGVVIGFLTAIAGLWLTLVLSRQLMTGRLVALRTDVWSVVRIVGAGLALSLALTLIGLLAWAVFASSGQSVLGLVATLVMPLVVYLVARLSFYVPALALNDPVTLRSSFAATRPFGGRLVATFLAVTAIGLAMGVVVALLPLPGPVDLLLTSCVGAAMVLVAQSVGSYLYWVHVRPFAVA